MRRVTSDEVRTRRRPWLAMAVFAALAVYLVFRFVQMGMWLVAWLLR